MVMQWSCDGESCLELASDACSERPCWQAVFRINYPRTDGYEKHVGSRTTFDIVNGHHAQRLGLVPAEKLRFLSPDLCDQEDCIDTVIRCHVKGCRAERTLRSERAAAAAAAAAGGVDDGDGEDLDGDDVGGGFEASMRGVGAAALRPDYEGGDGEGDDAGVRQGLHLSTVQLNLSRF